MNKRIFILTIIGLCFFGTAFGQSADFDYSDVYTLRAVYFISPTFPGTDGWIKILNDDGSPLSGDKNTMTWNGLTGTIKPAAYVSGEVGYVGADFKIDCDEIDLDEDNLYARAEGTDGYDLPPQQLEAFGGFRRYKRKPLSTYSGGAYTDKPFTASQVHFWESFKLTWFVSNDPNLAHGEWIEVETSSNPLYATYKKPEEDVNPLDVNQVDYPTQILHTTLNLSCRSAAGNTSEATIITSTYQQFIGKCVKTVNQDGTIGSGDCLGYWKDIATASSCASVSDLLTVGDARCQEWANFYNDMVRLQGIDQLRIAVLKYEHPLSPAILAEFEADLAAVFTASCLDLSEPIGIGNSTGIYVKNFNFGASTTFFFDDYNSQSSVTLCNGTVISDLDETGVPAQGGPSNDNPPAVFSNHAIVKDPATGNYYDPSYGLTVSSSANIWENKALDGYGADFVIPYIDMSGMMQEDLFLWMHKENITTSQQIIINP